MTGRSLAVQIKYGRSYTSKHDAHGYIYYGEAKHLNYLLNQPQPVLVIIADPDSGKCFWELVAPQTIELTPTAWKIHVPFENSLNATSRDRLEQLAGPALEYTKEFDAHWRTKQATIDSSLIIYSISRADFAAKRYECVAEFFEGLHLTKSLARRNQGKVEIVVETYDDDPRDLWEIPEAIAWFKAAEPVGKHWFFFLRTDPGTFSLPYVACCVCNGGTVTGLRSNSVDNTLVAADGDALLDFLERNFKHLNELTDSLGLPESDNKRISLAVLLCLGVDSNSLDGTEL
jgi:hypothetical protein